MKFDYMDSYETIEKLQRKMDKEKMNIYRRIILKGDVKAKNDLKKHELKEDILKKRAHELGYHWM